jgi:hypothetical protein
VTTLSDNHGNRIENPSNEQISEVLNHLNIEKDGEGFAILSKAEDHYVQVYGDQFTGFELEYQEGGLDNHYVAKRNDFKLQEIADIFAEYRDQTIVWQDVDEFDLLKF